MMLTSKPLALILFVVMFGGIVVSSILGWWQTESTKEPVKFAEGEFAGQANPVDIRGSYTFGDIARSFDITPELLAEAFQITTDAPETFVVKDLEAMYLDSGYEIGTNSVRMFVAFYVDLPFDTTGQEIYLPQAAVEILYAEAPLTSDQVTYLQAYTADVVPVSNPDTEPVPAQSEESALEAVPTKAAPEALASTDDYVVKGKTTFGDLISWGVPEDIIEQIIGDPMPDPAMKVKDYASANGLDFETLKTQLQAEVNKVKK